MHQKRKLRTVSFNQIKQFSLKTNSSVSTVSYMENLQEENSNSGGIKYENTYKLEPTKGGFPVKLLNIMLEEVLTDILEDQVYEQDNCPRFTKSISEVRFFL